MDRLASMDLGAHFFFQNQVRRPWLDPVAKGITFLGNEPVLMAVTVLAALLFLVARRPRTALAVVLSGFLSLSIIHSVKPLVGRDRPPEVVNPVIDGPNDRQSFPSGHALGSTAVYGAVALGLAQLLPRPGSRRLVIALGFALGFVIGVTRLYLGVHFVFDVVGGWTAGVACALFGHWFDLAFAPRGALVPELGPGPLAAGVGLTLPAPDAVLAQPQASADAIRRAGEITAG